MTAPLPVVIPPLPLGRIAGRDVVYLIQLEPDLDPTRLKVGFTTHLESRLRDFQAICPSARVLRSADGDRLVEAALIVNFDMSFRRLRRELFSADVAAAEARFDQVLAEVTG